ncbi:myb-like protein x [Anaeramoeba ignava]|uniref:Myb-like protein x n=1 Tax=Anaeramoeba ignava TaxID=1746090 RepID=A0A9Q0LEK8_ANAIG|nr:myb-like protein x [Anaeramoeba ignava]
MELIYYEMVENESEKTNEKDSKRINEMISSFLSSTPSVIYDVNKIKRWTQQKRIIRLNPVGILIIKPRKQKKNKNKKKKIKNKNKNKKSKQKNQKQSKKFLNLCDEEDLKYGKIKNIFFYLEIQRLKIVDLTTFIIFVKNSHFYKFSSDISIMIVQEISSRCQAKYFLFNMWNHLIFKNEYYFKKCQDKEPETTQYLGSNTQNENQNENENENENQNQNKSK